VAAVSATIAREKWIQNPGETSRKAYSTFENASIISEVFLFGGFSPSWNLAGHGSEVAD
jgi:hypothetical protein